MTWPGDIGGWDQLKLTIPSKPDIIVRPSSVQYYLFIVIQRRYPAWPATITWLLHSSMTTTII